MVVHWNAKLFDHMTLSLMNEGKPPFKIISIEALQDDMYLTLILRGERETYFVPMKLISTTKTL